MNRRGLFAFLSVAPAIAVGARVAKAAPKKIELDLPKRGDLDWGEKINDSFRKLEDAINKQRTS